jgi:drug/metabolite transporter (DMT)-like permease
MIILAFIGMCFAWGFSWFAMKLQTNTQFVALEVSLFYRFFAVSIIMFIFCWLTKTRLKLNKSELLYLPFIALCNFSLNFFIGYHTTKIIPSGIVAVVFSLSVITSELIKAWLDGHKISKKILLSGFIGTVGLTFFILPEVLQNNSALPVIGFVYAFFMMLVFSLGNYLVACNRKKNHTPLFTTISFASAFGAVYFLCYSLVLGYQFNFDYSYSYFGSLIYQIFFASILAFICLYYLINQIGTSKENYQFQLISTIGLFLIIIALSLDFFYHKIFK